MPVITFANTKGGAGKTTAVVLLASELLEQGYRVTVLDADPQCWFTHWAQLSPENPKLNVVTRVSATTIEAALADYKAKTDYFLIDLPGARTSLLATAIGLSDHVIIPIQGCAMDAQGGAAVIEILQYLQRKAGIYVPHSVVLTRVNPMVTTRALLTVKGLLAQRNVEVLGTPIVERSAFRDIFSTGGSLHGMDASQVSNLAKARENARAFANEILHLVPKRSRARTSKPVMKRAA